MSDDRIKEASSRRDWILIGILMALGLVPLVGVAYCLYGRAYFAAVCWLFLTGVFFAAAAYVRRTA